MFRKEYEVEHIVDQISDSGKSIYDAIGPDDAGLWLSTSEIETLLNKSLRGMILAKLPLRTRSKVVKQAVCKALGYPIPSSFKKSQPRFPGQNFDTYIQKANNLQIWNEDLDVTRRYVIIHVTAADEIDRVKVVDGAALAKLDKTGTLTQKYQARFTPSDSACELVSETDTALVQSILPVGKVNRSFAVRPTSVPTTNDLLPITEVFARLCSLVGISFDDAGRDQERNRGADLHRIVCEALGYREYCDSGTFPDITAQLLEVKLQTSPTIDLGLVTPDSTERLALPSLMGKYLRHCDVRYVLFYGVTDGVNVKLTHLAICTGADFFTRFSRFGGKVLNKKLQIPLPSDFFDL